MRIWPIVLLLILGSGYSVGIAAQAAATPELPSARLSPSLDGLSKTLGGLALDRWKKGSVREEAATNIQSIQRDLQSTLPGLLGASDAAPALASKALPVARNVDALYDVLLRVVDGARIAAPDDQFSQLQMALAKLDKARHAFLDGIQDSAAAQEKQTADLQTALKSQVAPVCPVAAAPTPALSVAKKVVKKKKAATPATSQPAAPAKPQS